MAKDFGTGKHTATDQRRYVERRQAVEQLKAVPCAECGQQYPTYIMDFDHRDPATKAFEISTNVARRAWGKLLAEISKCDVVCARCHRLRSWNPPQKPLRERQKLVHLLKAVPCADCGESFHHSQMDFDHVRGTKLGQVPKMSSLVAIRAEAAKCEIVCANCHRERSQRSGKGSARLDPSQVDMLWTHRSQVTPQTKVAPPSPRPWHPVVGTLSDVEVARQFGISRGSVRHFRDRRGIPPFQVRRVKASSRPGLQPLTWHPLLRTHTVVEVMSMTGMSRSRVYRVRKDLGISGVASG